MVESYHIGVFSVGRAHLDTLTSQLWKFTTTYTACARLWPKGQFNSLAAKLWSDKLQCFWTSLPSISGKLPCYGMKKLVWSNASNDNISVSNYMIPKPMYTDISVHYSLLVHTTRTFSESFTSDVSVHLPTNTIYGFLQTKILVRFHNFIEGHLHNGLHPPEGKMLSGNEMWKKGTYYWEVWNKMR